jgi:acyl transferase domain-containing protein/NADP-dependent 3-hydroxy acid dehydrogenase YdfG
VSEVHASRREGDRAPFPPLAIIGIGGLFPKSPSADAFWSLIKNGVDAITDVPPTHWDPADYFSEDKKKPDSTYARRGGFIDPYPFDPMKYGVPPNALEATDTSQLLGLVAAEQAMIDAGYGPGGKPFDRDRASVILGVTGALELVIPLGARLGHPMWREALIEAGLTADAADDVVRRIGERYVPWQENSFPGLLGNVVAGRISKFLNTGGTNCVVDAACASSLGALELAALELGTGKADLAITGGVDTFNDIFMYLCFSKTPALSPTGNARPFDAGCDGTILGEGLGMLVLKRFADAERDGDRIRAVVRGIGSSSDGKGEAIYAPSAAGQVKALRDAYGSAGVSPDTIELVEAHGTGTERGDAVEAGALCEVFCELNGRAPWCALGSIKSQIGHTKAAAGAAGLIKAALALEHKVLPPTIKVEKPAESVAPGASPFYVNAGKRPWAPRKGQPRRAGVSSFGFGGSNFHVVLEEYTAAKKRPDWDGNVQVFAFTDETSAAIASKLDAIPAAANWNAVRDAAHRSRAEFDPASARRLVFVVDRARTDLTKTITAIRAQLRRQPDAAWSLPDGVYYGVGPADGSVAFVFPGQGAQYPGMLNDLACLFPEMLDTLAAADEALGENARCERLSDLIYPHPAFDAETRAAQETALRATAVAQPALGAVSLGAVRVLERFGVVPACAAGHSYGELAALCAAGAFDVGTLIAMSRRRGELMESGEGDRGGMLAVRAKLSDIHVVVAEAKLALTPANKNAPDQVVLSGPEDEIERAVKEFSARNISNTRLNVAAAFHSAFVADAAGPFRAALDGAAFASPRIPVYANTTASTYPPDVESARDLLANQLARPVEFVAEIEAMYAGGVRTFVEVGPGARLTGLVGAILGDRPHRAVAVDASNGARDGVVDLARVLAALAAEGRACDLRRWDDGHAPVTVDQNSARRMTVPICGANYRSERSKPKPRPPVAGLQREADSVRQVDEARALVNPRGQDAHATEDSGRRGGGAAAETLGGALGELFRRTQESLAALQQMQGRTARTHAQYLQGQEAAARAFAQLIEQQERLFAQITAGGAAIGPISIEQRTAARAPGTDDDRIVTETSVESPATDELTESTADVLLEIVSEKTGYPREMLELGMALDADLGIDSIKRVEILSALQERIPGLPNLEPEELGAIATLGDIVAKLGENAAMGNVSGPEARATTDPRRRDGATTAEPLSDVLLAIVADKTGYPADMLELDMALDADLGIDSIKRVEILSAFQERVPDAPALEADALAALVTLRDVIGALESGDRPAPDAPAPAKKIAAAATAKPAGRGGITRQRLRLEPVPRAGARERLQLKQGGHVAVVGPHDGLTESVVSALRSRGFESAAHDIAAQPDPMENLCGAIVVETERPREAFVAVKSWGAALRKSSVAGQKHLVCVTRLDGGFGLRDAAAIANPEAGALAGLAKTAAREWPDLCVRAIDLAPDVADDEAARALVDELLVAGPVECGLSRDGAVTIKLEPLTKAATGGVKLSESDVIVVTGGARGVTAACALALARGGRPKLALIGRTPMPDAEPAWLNRVADERAVKKALLDHASEAISPQELERRYRAIASAREICETRRAIEESGSAVRYYAVDVRDSGEVRGILERIERDLGQITGIVHGAGVLADRRIEDKTPDQFDAVYDTKVRGIQNLLTAIGDAPLKFIALFSSSTGRFGRVGQADYAMANEALNKIARVEAARRPGCRVVSLNWGPWDGGMVTPALRKVFEREGIGVIPLEAGADLLEKELGDASGDVEVVVLAGSGLAPAAKSAQPLLTEVLTFELTPERYPFLLSHVIDGRPVLPVAMYFEWMAHAALHANPGLRFIGIEDLRVLKGVVLKGAAAEAFALSVSKPRTRGGRTIVTVELRGKTGGAAAILHSTAEVILGTTFGAGAAELGSQILPAYRGSRDDIYNGVLFHGPMFQGIVSVDGCGDDGISLAAECAPPPDRWIAEPMRRRWIADPLAIDCAFQAMVLWTANRFDQASLPVHIARYEQFQTAYPKGGVRIDARIDKASGHSATATIEIVDPSTGDLVARMDGYECVMDATLNEAFHRRQPLQPLKD